MKKLKYLGEPSSFVQHLLANDHRDSATLIREKLLEVCEQGKEHGEIKKSSERENQYSVQSLPGDSDGLMHPGYEAEFLILEEAVLVISLKALELH